VCAMYAAIGAVPLNSACPYNDVGRKVPARRRRRRREQRAPPGPRHSAEQRRSSRRPAAGGPVIQGAGHEGGLARTARQRRTRRASQHLSLSTASVRIAICECALASDECVWRAGRCKLGRIRHQLQQHLHMHSRGAGLGRRSGCEGARRCSCERRARVTETLRCERLDSVAEGQCVVRGREGGGVARARTCSLAMSRGGSARHLLAIAPLLARPSPQLLPLQNNRCGRHRMRCSIGSGRAALSGSGRAAHSSRPIDPQQDAHATVGSGRGLSCALSSKGRVRVEWRAGAHRTSAERGIGRLREAAC
jgi:hypothetical protein